jgi:hypothetical protein
MYYCIFYFKQKRRKLQRLSTQQPCIAETLSKELNILKSKSRNGNLKIDEKFVKDSIITKGKSRFRQKPRNKKPCPDYLLTILKKSVYEITLENVRKP